MKSKKHVAQNDAAQQRLLQYLSGQMDHATAHEFEKEAENDPFLQEALEGLNMVDKNADLNNLVQSLNSGLKKQIGRRRKRSLHTYKEIWIYVAVLVVLAIIVVTYFVVTRLIN